MQAVCHQEIWQEKTSSQTIFSSWWQARVQSEPLFSMRKTVRGTIYNIKSRVPPDKEQLQSGRKVTVKRKITRISHFLRFLGNYQTLAHKSVYQAFLLAPSQNCNWNAWEQARLLSIEMAFQVPLVHVQQSPLCFDRYINFVYALIHPCKIQYFFNNITCVFANQKTQQ